VTVDLAERFEADRSRLRSVGYRMLGSFTEADDAVQEAWIRASRAGADDVENLSGWLTTIVGRVCLDMLRSRTSRREESLDDHVPDAVLGPDGDADPERAAVEADSVGHALLVVLDTLAPAERLAFVLHDMFSVPFDEIAIVAGRSTAATRQLASRARRRVQDSDAVPDTDLGRQREIVDAFLAASREGDFAALLSVLDPDVVVRSDAANALTGPTGLVLGARAVAERFSGRARAAQPALVDGLAGAAWAPGGQARVVFDFRIVDGRITSIDLLADAEVVGGLDLVLLGT
jgi:RNA polymerase sigma-70 factor (ECF subfamily)